MKVIKCIDAARTYNFVELNRNVSKLNATGALETAVVELVKWENSFLLDSVPSEFPAEKLKPLEQGQGFYKALFFIYYSDYINSKNLNETNVFQILMEALSISERLNRRILICEALKRLIDMVNYKQEDYDLLDLLTLRYQYHAYDSFEKDLSYLYRIRALSAMEQLPHIKDFLKGRAGAVENGNMSLVPYYDKLLGVKYEVYSNYLTASGISSNNYETSLKHYDLSIPEYAKFLPSKWARNRLTGIYINKGINYHFQKKLDSATNFLDHARNMVKDSSDYNNILIAKWKGENFYEKGLLDSAYYYKNLELELRRARYTQKTDASISEIYTKYETEKKEKQIRNTRNWLIAASLALLLGTGIAILLQKNTTKKRQLAEQEAVLKQQRVENLLKEQELVSIDAMIAGQEKERKKVAGELHDDLGSLMATIKLHFDNAKMGKKDPALQNAQKLLEEAYQKVRGMAHHKNSGVMSDQGLLPAIKRMARTISKTDALEVTVEDFGLGERMENSLELSIFRMVQELVANVIKHAEASKVNIQLTQHEDNLNIIVEDNGKGFDRSTFDKDKSGMGLTNIEKRVEHLEGNFTIDSILGKGTSILIDIPV